MVSAWLLFCVHTTFSQFLLLSVSASQNERTKWWHQGAIQKCDSHRSPCLRDRTSIEVSSTFLESNDDTQSLRVVPLSFKLASILMVSAIGFGSSWSGGITGAMKTALKKVNFTPPTSVLKHPNNLYNGYSLTLRRALILNSLFSKQVKTSWSQPSPYSAVSSQTESVELVRPPSLLTSPLPYHHSQNPTETILYGNIIYIIGSIFVAGAQQSAPTNSC